MSQVLSAGRSGRGYPSKPYQRGPRRRRSFSDSGLAIRNKPGVPNAPGFFCLPWVNQSYRDAKALDDFAGKHPVVFDEGFIRSTAPRRENGAQLVQKMHKLKKPQISQFNGLFHFMSREHVRTVKTKTRGVPGEFWATRDNRSRGRPPESRGRPPENEKLAVLRDENRVSIGTQLGYKRLHIAMKCRVYLDADDILPQSLLWKKTRKASTRAAHIEYARSASVV